MAKKETSPDKKTVDRNRLRTIAEDMFIRQGITLTEISDTLSVSMQTLSNSWAKGRPGEKCWKARRNEAQVTPVKLKEILMSEAYNLSQGLPAKINADGMSKIIAAIDKLDKKVSVRVVTDVLKDLDNFISETDPKKSVETMQLHKRFIQYRISLES